MRALFLALLVAACDAEQREPVDRRTLFSEGPTTELQGASRGMAVLSESRIAVTDSVGNTIDLFDAPADRFVLTASVAVGVGPRAVVTGDFDGDGRTDLVTADTSGGTVTILVATDADFEIGATRTLAGPPFDLVADDLDGDGRDDIVVGRGANAGETAVDFLPAIDVPGPPERSIDLQGLSAVARFDANWDGTRDVVALTSSPDPRIRTIEASETTPGPPVCTGGTSPIAADLTGDGSSEIVVACSSGGIDVLDAAGGRTHLEGGTSIYDLAAADFDGDGLMDVAGVDPFDHVLYVWFGGTPMEPRYEYGTERGPIRVEVFDQDGDGDQDLVLLAFEARLLEILTNHQRDGGK